MPAQRDALSLAVQRYCDDNGEFDARAWTEAFESSDPPTINSVLEVTAGYQGLVNHLLELLRAGAQLAELTIASGSQLPSGPKLIAAARDDGCFTDKQAEVLTQLYRTRNRLQHASPDIEADDVREHVILLLKALPRLLRSYAAWMDGHGFPLLPRGASPPAGR